MGRRKIEIKPIRDDRNRSVTFLKRKGGLFKKAHELSVLCQVDVAVIIFGNNKKLYEYSSADINEVVGRFQYYGGAHEHKGPQDFADKGGGDDDDEDDEGGDEGEGRGTTPQPEPPMMRMQHHPGFQHVRHVTPQNSPPMHNGQMPPFQRTASPMPQNISRPSSRASQQHPGHMRRASSNLVPQPHPAGVPPPQNYAYTPNPPFYNPQAQMQRPPGQPIQHPQGSTYPPPYPPQGAPHAQMQQVMMQDNRRSSMPPTVYGPQGSQGPPQQASMQRNPSQEHLQPPQHPQRHPSPRPQQQQQQQQQQAPPQQRATPSPQPPQQHFTSPPVPQAKALPAHAKSQSMFTPIDDSRSMLAAHWGATSTSNAAEANIKAEARAASLDAGSTRMTAPSRGGDHPNGAPSPALKSPQRTASTPLARSSTGQADAKRPRLKVQIPSEQSGDEGGTASAPDESAVASTAGQSEVKPAPERVVLPPPSPSAGALLSAGAQGPPNPFARPPPPMSTNPHAANRDASASSAAAGGSTANNGSNNNNNIETPISALPSRFMSDNLLPSPSTFYPEWGFGRQGDGNMLPSPLTFQTPVVGNGGGWREEDRKRERDKDGEGGDEAGGKRVKS